MEDLKQQQVSIVDNESELKKVIEQIVMKDKITQQLCKLPILRESHNPVPKRLEVSVDYIQMQKRNNSVLDNYKSQYSITRDKVVQSQIEKNLSIERLKTILDKNFDKT